MENFALAGLIESLRPAMSEVVIRRIIQHQPDGFIFQTRSVRLPAIKIVADPRQPALYASEARPPQDQAATDFLMVLRKHLTSAELIKFEKPLSERVVEFVFKTTVPSKELEVMSLVLELLPNAPNIILLDAERRVLASFAPVTPQHGMGEYEEYSYPRAGDKISLEQILEGDIPALNEFTSVEDPQRWLIQHVAGIGPVYAGEIVYRQKKSGRPVADEIRETMEQIRAVSRSAWLYTELPLGHILETNDLRRLSKAILSPIPLESLERTHSSRIFANILEGARFFFDEIETRTLLEHAKAPVLRDLKDAVRRLNDKEKRLLREQQKYEEAAGLHKTAQLLTSSGLPMDQHYESARVTDYFSDRPAEITVPLDSTMSLRENIDRMFKRHSKSGRGKQMAVQQLADVRRKRERLDDQIRRLHSIRDWDTWLAIVDKLERERRPKSPGIESTEPTERRFRGVVVDGKEILVGRNGAENDELTFHYALPDDFWLHVADYTGSHVVVRNPNRERELDANVLTKAAQLAAYFSQARNSSKVEVHYTRRKHVVKPKRAKAGLVRLLEFKSITVEPRNWL